MPYVPAGTNHGNNFAYGTAAKRRATMRNMYSLTGDVWYLDQAMSSPTTCWRSATIRTPAGCAWTGKREPCWPNNDDTAPDTGACGMETGAVANQILSVAKMIFADKSLWAKPAGIGTRTVRRDLRRSRPHVPEGGHRSMDYVPGTSSIRCGPDPHPDGSAYTALGPNYLKAAGRAVPWNQQEMMTGPLAEIDDILTALGEHRARRRQRGDHQGLDGLVHQRAGRGQQVRRQRRHRVQVGLQPGRPLSRRGPGPRQRRHQRPLQA